MRAALDTHFGWYLKEDAQPVKTLHDPGQARDNPHLLFLANGRDYHVRKWTAAIAAQGIRLTLGSFHPPEEPPPGVETVRIPAASEAASLKWLDFPRARGRLQTIIGTVAPDVLLGSFATTYGFLAYLSGFHPYIVTTWSRDVTIVPFVGRKRFVFRPIVRRVLHAADAVTTDGPAHAQIVKERFPEISHKVHATTWGISLADYRLDAEAGRQFRRAHGIPEDVPLVVSGRGVRSWYRPEVVLPALRQLLDRHQTVYTVVLTLAQERTSEVQGYLEELISHPRAVVFDRFLDVPEMRALWSTADVTVSVPAMDGVSEALLEALYAGCIAVVNDIPSNRAVFEENHRAVYVYGERPDDVTATVMRVLNSLPELKERMVEDNIRWVRENASIEGTAAQVASLVRRLAAKHPS